MDEMNYHPLPKKYLDTLNSIRSYRLAIMGKDPYPTEPNGIPFCKSSWDNLSTEAVSGFNVLNSLGVDIDAVRIKFCNPCEYFTFLANEKGIIFLNLSYYFLDGVCRKKKHSIQLQNSEIINRELLLKSENIILCGEAKKIEWYEYVYNNVHYAPHPDVRCKRSVHSHVRESWIKWWEKNALNNKFNLSI